MKTSALMRLARAFLILGRVSNLPTVWSNCLAGWWLGGAGNLEKLPFLFVGATFLYVGGMFLNDAFDAEFDRQHRKERPIPSGGVSASTVWIAGVAWLVIGEACLFYVGGLTGSLGVALVISIVVYDAVHKRTVFSPVLMAICRFLLYVIAASAGVSGPTGWSLLAAFALASYIMGLSYLARRESLPGLLRQSPLLFLGLPIVLALVRPANSHTEGGLLLSAVLGLWIVKSLRSTLWSAEPDIGRTVSGLLAGIVLVDWVAVADAPRVSGFIFIALFLTALFFQRFVPAT